MMKRILTCALAMICLSSTAFAAQKSPNSTLEQDWLLQVKHAPTALVVRQEIEQVRKLAKRISTRDDSLDFSKPLAELSNEEADLNSADKLTEIEILKAVYSKKYKGKTNSLDVTEVMKGRIKNGIVTGLFGKEFGDPDKKLMAKMTPHEKKVRMRRAKKSIAVTYRINGVEQSRTTQSSSINLNPHHIEAYLAVRRIKREIMFKNPTVDFDKVLLVDNPYPTGRHESRHRHGFKGFRGEAMGRLLVLEGLNPDSPVRALVPKGTQGHFWRPDLSFDGKKVVFCMMPKGELSFNLYEVNVDGTGFKQLTFGDYDDLDPIFLPNGKLLFVTTRANTHVRCGPTHPSPVLAICDGDGKNIYVVSRGNEPDYQPALLPDGRVIYTRWEYTDKEQKRVQALWTMNPDGTGVTAYWGNQSVWPDMVVQARPIPGTSRVMFTGSGHHRWFNGPIAIIDPAGGMNYPDGLTKVTSDIPWAEVGNGPNDKNEEEEYQPGGFTAYHTPYPIGEKDFLVSAKHPETGLFSLYLMDFYGNRELIYKGNHNVWHAMPFAPRKAPVAIPDRVEWPEIGPNQPPLKDGVLYSANVFEGMPKFDTSKVKYLRVLAILAQTYTPWKKTYQHSGPSISATQADGVKKIFGTTDVEKDGSVCFYAPPGVALHFQLLDDQYRCVQTMRSFTGVMPGETRGCVGCHEERSNAPVNTPGGLAMRRGPQKLTPPPWGAETIGYERFVQPVFDQYCIACHNPTGKAKKLDLTLRKSNFTDPVWRKHKNMFKEPYLSLVGGGNNFYSPTKGKLNADGHPITLAGVLNVEGYRERTMVALETLKPMTHLSSASVLLDKATDPKHVGKKLDERSRRRLIGWIDANGPFLGEEEIRQMPDPEPRDDIAVQPRLRTAPKINRFNIRQDGDSSKVFYDMPPLSESEQKPVSKADNPTKGELVR